jgi:hypothetical protein
MIEKMDRIFQQAQEAAARREEVITSADSTAQETDHNIRIDDIEKRLAGATLIDRSNDEALALEADKIVQHLHTGEADLAAWLKHASILREKLAKAVPAPV